MKIYSYIVTHDTGFAPNPFWGYCTIACCKPSIRRSATKGDWIVGLAPKKHGHRVVFFMRVDEILTFDQYWRDKRFRRKRPKRGSVIFRRGDNIYQPLPSAQARPMVDRYRQLSSMHSNKDKEDTKEKKHDLSGVNVLISKRFAYFGSKAQPLPRELEPLKVARGHRILKEEEHVDLFHFFTRWRSKWSGRHGAPSKWPKDDQSCESGLVKCA